MAKTAKKTTAKKSTKKVAAKRKRTVKNPDATVDKYKNKVAKVLTRNDKTGKPLTVRIKCQDKLAGKNCEKTRDIKVQDLFQVERCNVCQKVYSRERLKKNRKPRKAAAKKAAPKKTAKRAARKTAKRAPRRSAKKAAAATS